MSAPQLDDLDRQLIEVLARDARVSNRKIALDLGVDRRARHHRAARFDQALDDDGADRRNQPRERARGLGRSQLVCRGDEFGAADLQRGR